MTVWFHAPEFRYNATPSGSFIVRAYIATFQNTNYREPFKLCMLHDDWHGTFPLRHLVLKSLALEFGTRKRLDLAEPLSCSCSYGYVQRSVNWKRYQCCYSNWIGWFCPICETQRWYSHWGVRGRAEWVSEVCVETTVVVDTLGPARHQTHGLRVTVRC